MAAPNDDFVTILGKLIQQNPIVGLGAAFIVALWWIGKNDNSTKPKEEAKEMTEDELIIALAKARAKKISADSTGVVLTEIKKLIEALEENNK